MTTMVFSNNDLGEPGKTVLVEVDRPEKGLVDLLDLNNIQTMAWSEIQPLLDEIRDHCNFYREIGCDEIYAKLEMNDEQ